MCYNCRQSVHGRMHRKHDSKFIKYTGGTYMYSLDEVRNVDPEIAQAIEMNRFFVIQIQVA